jgi:succinate dehydrogenase hydrophobic anchor subunit
MTDVGLPTEETSTDEPAAEAAADESSAAEAAEAAEADAGVPPEEGDAVEPYADPPNRPELPLAAQIARTTGLLLLILVPIHLGSLMVHDPEIVNTAYLVDRWANRWWLLADWGLLVVGTVHAVLSIWGRLMSDGARTSRVLIGGALTTLTVALFFAASAGMLRLQ